VRRNPDYGQLAQTSLDLRRGHLRPVSPFAFFLPFGFHRHLEHPRLIRVERQRSAEPLQIRPQQTHILFAGIVPHEACEEPAGGIVDHRNQVDRFAAPFQPVVGAGVPLHQFATTAPPRPPLVHFRYSNMAGPPQPRLGHPASQRFLAHRYLV
jgi:hypothetical protein